jgi:5'-nucleotidase
MMQSLHEQNGKRPVRVLVDMDGVMCDFEGHMLAEFRKAHPSDPYVAPEDRSTFYMSEQYELIQPGLGVKVKEIMKKPGFFRSMPPIKGAVSAIKEMDKMEGVQVFICTAPIEEPFFCVKEKYEWVNCHLGKEWMQRIILTHDKTLIIGDILIDDKHEVSGSIAQPSWDHIIFTQCHNRHLANLRTCKFADRLDSWTDGSWYLLVDSYRQRVVGPVMNV